MKKLLSMITATALACSVFGQAAAVLAAEPQGQYQDIDEKFINGSYDDIRGSSFIIAADPDVVKYDTMTSNAWWGSGIKELEPGTPWCDYRITPNGPCDILMMGSSRSDASPAWRYEEETGTLILSGTGSTPDYLYEGNDDDGGTTHETPWKDYRDVAKKIRIEEGVTGIGARNFDDFSALEEVTFPDSMESVAASAFPKRTDIVMKGKCCSPVEVYAFEMGYAFAPTDQFLRGDMNGDQAYGSEDALTILKMIVKLTPYCGYSGDADENGEVTAQDALVVLRKVVKL